MRKYNINDDVKFIFKVNNIPNTYEGIIEKINKSSRLPYCVKLKTPIETCGLITSYVSIDKKQIL